MMEFESRSNTIESGFARDDGLGGSCHSPSRKQLSIADRRSLFRHRSTDSGLETFSSPFIVASSPTSEESSDSSDRSDDAAGPTTNHTNDSSTTTTTRFVPRCSFAMQRRLSQRGLAVPGEEVAIKKTTSRMEGTPFRQESRRNLFAASLAAPSMRNLQTQDDDVDGHEIVVHDDDYSTQPQAPPCSPRRRPVVRRSSVDAAACILSPTKRHSIRNMDRQQQQRPSDSASPRRRMGHRSSCDVLSQSEHGPSRHGKLSSPRRRNATSSRRRSSNCSSSTDLLTSQSEHGPSRHASWLSSPRRSRATTRMGRHSSYCSSPTDPLTSQSEHGTSKMHTVLRRPSGDGLLASPHQGGRSSCSSTDPMTLQSEHGSSRRTVLRRPSGEDLLGTPRRGGRRNSLTSQSELGCPRWSELSSEAKTNQRGAWEEANSSDHSSLSGERCSPYGEGKCIQFSPTKTTTNDSKLKLDFAQTDLIEILDFFEE